MIADSYILARRTLLTSGHILKEGVISSHLSIDNILANMTMSLSIRIWRLRCV